MRPVAPRNRACGHWPISISLVVMKDIRHDLRERLDSIAKDSVVLRARLAQNDAEEAMLKSLLQREDARFGKLDASLPAPTNGDHAGQSKTGGTPLSRFIVNTIRQAKKPVTLDDLKQAAETIGYDFGTKKPGRVLHWALVAMNENGIIRPSQSVHGGWKMKEVRQ
jgi:hypothetical protein